MTRKLNFLRFQAIKKVKFHVGWQTQRDKKDSTNLTCPAGAALGVCVLPYTHTVKGIGS